MNNRERNSLDRYITGNYGEDQFRGQGDNTPDIEPDDPRSMGHCLIHGDYDGRNLRCPECDKNAEQEDDCGGCELDCEICGVHQSDYESLSKHYDWHNDQNAKRGG